MRLKVAGNFCLKSERKFESNLVEDSVHVGLYGQMILLFFTRDRPTLWLDNIVNFAKYILILRTNNIVKFCQRYTDSLDR